MASFRESWRTAAMSTEGFSLPPMQASPASSLSAGSSLAAAVGGRSVAPQPILDGLSLTGMSRGDLFIAGLIVGLFSVVFVIDLLTPAERVLVCFLYSLPLFVALVGHKQPVFLYAALATVLGGLGAWLEPPIDAAAATFAATRTFSLSAVWVAAGLIAWRKWTDTMVQNRFEFERQKAESRGEFLDLLSHEVGSSLTAIEGQAFCLRRLAGTPAAPGDVAVRAEKIHDSIHQIKTLVARIQTASEAGERCLRARSEPVDLHKAVSDVVLMGTASYPQRTIEVDIHSLPTQVFGDRCMLKQVVGNLLSNAIKYSTDSSPVRVEGRIEENAAVIAVIDQGRGIAEEDRERLFAPYFRGRNSRGVPGSGIGLYVCERFVASHGGTISVDSKLDVGTTVTVRLPIETNFPDSRNDSPPANPLH